MPDVSRLERLVDPVDREAFVRARELARACVADLLAVPEAEVTLAQRCATCGGTDHGRPFAVGRPGIGVSWSHCGGRVAAFAAPGPCGVDVEIASDGPVPLRVLTGREQAWLAAGGEFTRLWTRKEALVKAGVATLDDAGELDVLDDEVRGFVLRTRRQDDAVVSTAQSMGSSTNTGILRSVFFW